jgi:spermidine synthase
MTPWKLIDRAPVPGGEGEMSLYARGEEFSIRVAGQELMNSRLYAVEDALAKLGCEQVRQRRAPCVLIGGLGMGYALATALRTLGRDARVVVAELVPAVVTWNETHLGHLAEHPLRDDRVTLERADVAAVMKQATAAFDAILLDVDNGPDGLTRASNDWLYGRAGLASAARALRPQGVLGVWSTGQEPAFVRRLRAAGFEVDERSAPSRGKRGARHTIWLATQRRVSRAQA